MKTQRYYGWTDHFRLIAALLVIAIHTSPLSSLSGDADFFFTRVLARVAVPFFFMVTGQFILGPLFSSDPAVTLCPPPFAKEPCRERPETLPFKAVRSLWHIHPALSASGNLRRALPGYFFYGGAENVII